MSATLITDSIDVTSELAELITHNRRVYIPERSVPYTIALLQLRNGTELIFDPAAKINGPSALNGVIFVTDGSTTNVVLEGGEFSNAQYLWKHTGTSQLAYVSIRNVVTKYVACPFDLSACVAVRFDECELYYCTDAGIRFSGLTNCSEVHRCKITLGTGVAIDFSQSDQARFQNTITNCVFEQMTKGAIKLSGNNRNLVVRDCYIERCGADGSPDVTISGNQHVILESCAFANPMSAQSKRINITGLATVRVNNCSARIVKTGDVFIYVDTNYFDQDFNDNYLNCTGDRVDYVNRLFQLAPGRTCPVTWTGNLGSGGVNPPVLF